VHSGSRKTLRRHQDRPAGRIVLVSDFSYEAKTTHFSGYWTMLLADSTPSVTD
jgi:hypothetical protein